MSDFEEVKVERINSLTPTQGESFKLDFKEIDGEKYISHKQFLEYQDWKSKTTK